MPGCLGRCGLLAVFVDADEGVGTVVQFAPIPRRGPHLCRTERAGRSTATGIGRRRAAVDAARPVGLQHQPNRKLEAVVAGLGQDGSTVVEWVSDEALLRIPAHLAHPAQP